MSKEELKRIGNALEWYAGTDGSERELAADELYNILIDIYNRETKKDLKE